MLFQPRVLMPWLQIRKEHGPYHKQYDFLTGVHGFYFLYGCPKLVSYIKETLRTTKLWEAGAEKSILTYDVYKVTTLEKTE
jgi:hypothetical protein